MSERTSLRAFVLFLFLVFVLSVSGAAFAAIVVTPVPGGVTKVTSIPVGLDGHLRYQGQGAWNPLTRSYSGTSSISLGGKLLTIPNKTPLVSSAAQLAKNAMRLNPTALAGSLALAWLLGEGLEYVNGSWMLEETLLWINATPIVEGTDRQTMCQQYFNQVGSGWCTVGVNEAPPYAGVCTCNGAEQALIRFGTTTNRPATQEDFDKLPDPIPEVGPEIPNADWWPEGAPVDAPTHEDGNHPVGEPYKKPDGSTWQDGVTITANNNTSNTTNNTWNTVTITNYSTKISEADGTPVAEPVAEEQPDQQQDECEKRPNSIGCADMGSDEFAAPTATHNFTFEPEADVFTGSCPAPIQVLGHSISYQPACDAMGMIRPVVLGMAGLMAAFILFGAFRGGD